MRMVSYDEREKEIVWWTLLTPRSPWKRCAHVSGMAFRPTTIGPFYEPPPRPDSPKRGPHISVDRDSTRLSLDILHVSYLTTLHSVGSPVSRSGRCAPTKCVCDHPDQAPHSQGMSHHSDPSITPLPRYRARLSTSPVTCRSV